MTSLLHRRPKPSQFSSLPLIQRVNRPRCISSVGAYCVLPSQTQKLLFLVSTPPRSVRPTSCPRCAVAAVPPAFPERSLGRGAGRAAPAFKPLPPDTPRDGPAPAAHWLWRRHRRVPIGRAAAVPRPQPRVALRARAASDRKSVV